MARIALVITAMVVLSFQAKGQFAISNGNFTKCQKDEVVLRATQAPYLSDYKWYIESIPIALGSADTFVVGNINLFDHVYVATADSAGVTLADTINIFVFGEPTLELGPNLSLCQGDSTTIRDLTPTGGLITYSWNTGEDTDSLVIDSTAHYILTKTGPFPNPCSTIDTVSLEVTPQPVILASADTAVCFGDTSLLGFKFTSPGTAPYQSKWTGPFAIDDTSASSTFSTDTISGFAIIQVIDDSPGQCQSIDSMEITVRPRLSSSLVADSVLICRGATASLEVTPTGGTPSSSGYSFDWTGTALNETTSSIVTADPSSTSQYNVLVTDSTSCTTEASGSIYVTQVEISIDQASSNVKCPTDSMEFTTQTINAVGTPSYQWSLYTTTIAGIDSDITVTDTGWYYVIVTDQKGCIDQDSVQLQNSTTAENISITLTEDSTICNNSTIELSISTDAIGPTFDWFLNSSSLGLASQAIQSTDSGWYRVVVSNEVGCIAQDSTLLSYYDIQVPIISSTSAPDSSINDQSVLLEVDALGDNLQYLWTNDGLGTMMNPSLDTSSYLSSISDLNWVYFTVVVSNLCGSAQATDSIFYSARAVPENILYIPNTLVPSSSDDDAAHFRVYGNTLAESGFVFRVFDRTGFLLYEATSLSAGTSEGWDGTDPRLGDLARMGVYNYLISGTYTDGSSFEEVGTISLIR